MVERSTPRSRGRGEDRAAEQLFDELCTRAWELGRLAPRLFARPSQPRVAQQLSRLARDVVGQLRTAGPAERQRFVRTLFPGCEPDPAWWSTPLGRVLSGESTEETDR